MGRGLGGGGGKRCPAETVQHQGDYVTLAALQRFRVTQGDADRGRDGARVDQGKPAERDDAEQQLRGFARRRVVETELRADRGQSFLPGGEMVHPGRRWRIAQSLALDQTDEV